MRAMRSAPQHHYRIRMARRLAGALSTGVRRTIRCGSPYLVPGLLVALVAFAVMPAAQAQHSPMDAVAAQIADAISHAKQKSVIVFDFSGPDTKVTPLGRVLADDFSAALEKSAPALRVEKRSRISDAIEHGDFALELLSDAGSTLALARELHVDALVMGQLSIARGQATVTVFSYRVPNGESIKGFRVTWPLTEQMEQLTTKDLTEPDSMGGWASFPQGGKNGYTTASCISCAPPDFSREALARKIEGVIELRVVVREDGRIGQIRIVKGLPLGLTAAAIEAVKKWKLTPARGPDRKPAAVQQMIGISFNRY
jgi:TonB family protein